MNTGPVNMDYVCGSCRVGTQQIAGRCTTCGGPWSPRPDTGEIGRLASAGDRFSIILNGRDLRATILFMLDNAVGDGLGTTDPATLVDDMMVALGFEPGYDETGDYTPGYRDYMTRVGLIQERSS